jgi:hypothetical protein
MTIPDIEGLQRRVAAIIIRDVLQEEPDDLVEGYLDEIMLAAHRIIQLPAYRFVAEGYANNIAAEITRLRAALAEQEWQPIETAPRDGTIILIAINVRGDGPTVYEARWNEISECFSGRNGFLLFDGAHAWRPLPAPPVEKDNG